MQSDGGQSYAERKQRRVMIGVDVRAQVRRRRPLVVVVVAISVVAVVLVGGRRRRRVITGNPQPRRQPLDVRPARTSRQLEVRRDGRSAVGRLAQTRPFGGDRRPRRRRRTTSTNAPAVNCYRDAVALTTVAMTIAVDSAARAVFRNRSQLMRCWTTSSTTQRIFRLIAAGAFSSLGMGNSISYRFPVLCRGVNYSTCCRKRLEKLARKKFRQRFWLQIEVAAKETVLNWVFVVVGECIFSVGDDDHFYFQDKKWLATWYFVYVYTAGLKSVSAGCSAELGHKNFWGSTFRKATFLVPRIYLFIYLFIIMYNKITTNAW